MADSLKALTYAEQQLGVHEAYDQAMKYRKALDDAMSTIVGGRLLKREHEAMLADREMELVADERGKHPEMPVTRMDSHMKEVKHNDPKCRELRGIISSHTAAIDAAESVKMLAEVDVKIAVARLTELGGYLNYLAAVKNHQANNANETNTAQEQTTT